MMVAGDTTRSPLLPIGPGRAKKSTESPGPKRIALRRPFEDVSLRANIGGIPRSAPSGAHHCSEGDAEDWITEGRLRAAQVKDFLDWATTPR